MPTVITHLVWFLKHRKSWRFLKHRQPWSFCWNFQPISGSILLPAIIIWPSEELLCYTYCSTRWKLCILSVWITYLIWYPVYTSSCFTPHQYVYTYWCSDLGSRSHYTHSSEIVADYFCFCFFNWGTNQMTFHVWIPCSKNNVKMFQNLICSSCNWCFVKA